MLLLFHITIALTSLIASSLLYLTPSPRRFRLSFGLVVLTIISGTILTVSEPAHLMQACISGLVYISLVLILITASYRRLAKVPLER